MKTFPLVNSFAAVIEAQSAPLRELKGAVARARDRFAESLRQRLLEGEDTEVSRDALALADQVLDVADGLVGWGVGVGEGAIAAEANLATAISVQTLAADLGDAVAGLTLPSGLDIKGADAGEFLEADSPTIVAACYGLEQAKLRLATAAAVLSEATAAEALVTKRIEEKDAERAAIATRRQAGGGKAEDAGALALIMLDREGLEAELARSHGPVIAARAAHTAAASAVVAREHDLGEARRAALEEALIAFLRRVDAAMLEGIAKLAALHRGGLPRWGGSVALRDAMRTLAVQRREL